MGSINLAGFLPLVWNYKYNLKGNDFSKALRDGIKPGIYKGGYLTVKNSTTVTLSTFAAYFKALGIDGNNKIFRAESTTTVDLSPTVSNPVVLASYTYVEATANYPDFAYRATSDAPVTNEIVFGTALFSGVVIVGVDYSLRTQGLFDEAGNTHVNNLVIGGDIKDNSDSYTLNYNLTDNSQNKDGSYEVKRLDDETGTGRNVSSFTAPGTIVLNTGHGIAIGDRIEITGATSPSNNGSYLVSNVVTNTITVSQTFKQVTTTEAGGSAKAGKWVDANLVWSETNKRWQATYEGEVTSGIIPSIVRQNDLGGILNWQSGVVYNQYSLVMNDGLIWESKHDNNNSGIVPATDTTNWREYIPHMVGEPFPVFSSGVIDGTLALDGSTGLSTTAYPRLARAWANTPFIVSGVITLPDMRNRFLRGFQTGVGRTIGDFQAHEFKTHRHKFKSVDNYTTTIGSGGGTVTRYVYGSSNDYAYYDAVTDATETESPWSVIGGTETRPDNLNALWVIKY